jgi:phosphate transport system protein
MGRGKEADMIDQRVPTAWSTAPVGPRLRAAFQQDLCRLELDLQDMAVLARNALQRAVRALIDDHQALAASVVAGDDEVDRRYLDIERRVIGLLARQAPVAGDLRLLTAILHVSLHLERIGDMAVNVARITQLATGMPRKQRVVRHLEEMAETSAWMVDLAMRAFRDRDADGCRRLPLIDDRVDELNRSMLVALAASAPLGRLEWGVQLYEAARQLERAADHAVDIAEQVWFLVTGELLEFGGTARTPMPASAPATSG